MVLSDYLPNASEGTGTQHSAHGSEDAHPSRSEDAHPSCSEDAHPSCILVKKSLCRSAICLPLHAIGASQVWLQLHIYYCNAQHQVAIQASTTGMT